MKTSPPCVVLAAFAAANLSAQTPAENAGMKVSDLRAGGEEKKRYFVIHRPVDPPKEGWRTLFVLPGGSGNAEFQPFVARIAENALPETYLVVQLVAPVWNAKQAENLVWPIEKTEVPGLKFTTPEFYADVRAEVAKAHKLDPRFSFTLSWSSGGPAAYALSLMPKSGLTGSFVAMSVFRVNRSSEIRAAKGHAYFLYHSPQDFIPISQAESARTALQKAGATVELHTYEGGHGWKGDVFGDIRKGIDWLEQQVAAGGK